MFTEFLDDPSDPNTTGTVEINTEYEAFKKPVWLIVLKLAGLVALMAVGYVLVMPLLPLPLWQSIVAATGVLLIYVGVAFFVRPEANTDNMGWLGGMANDPFQMSDNVNRFLWSAHCFLGPGRFISETVLDTCILLGLMEEAQLQAPPQPKSQPDQQPFEPTASLQTDRYASPAPSDLDECQGLTTARFLKQVPDAESPQP